MFDLSRKAALVTGGNSGVGLGFATGLARQGASLVIWGRDPAKNKAAEQILRDAGATEVRSAIVDVTSETAVIAGFSAAVSAMGRLDCVVSNAGHAATMPSVMETDADTWLATLDVHMNGGFYVVREAARHMAARSETAERGGSILICGSLAVFAGGQGLSHYAAAKGGLASLMKSVAAEVGQYGVRVNMVAPGYIKTSMAGDANNDAFFGNGAPLGRIGNPADLAGIAAYLVSDEASFHTGDVITVDGGWMASLF